MSEYVSPETLNDFMSELTTNTVVGMMCEMAKNGNYLIRRIDGNGTIELAQNYTFINPITLEGYIVTIMASHKIIEQGCTDKPNELSLWLDDGDGEEEWYCFRQDDDDTYYTLEPLTESLGYQLITILENSELRDNLTPEDIAAPDGGDPVHFRRKHPD